MGRYILFLPRSGGAGAWSSGRERAGASYQFCCRRSLGWHAHKLSPWGTRCLDYIGIDRPRGGILRRIRLSHTTRERGLVYRITVRNLLSDAIEGCAPEPVPSGAPYLMLNILCGQESHHGRNATAAIWRVEEALLRYLSVVLSTTTKVGGGESRRNDRNNRYWSGAGLTSFYRSTEVFSCRNRVPRKMGASTRMPNSCQYVRDGLFACLQTASYTQSCGPAPDTLIHSLPASRLTWKAYLS